MFSSKEILIFKQISTKLQEISWTFMSVDNNR